VDQWQRDASLAAVAAQAAELVESSFRLADRGALYSARAELLAALQAVCKSLDARAGTACYTRELGQGLQALREADDFAGRGSPSDGHVNVAAAVATHRTPVLKNRTTEGMPAVVAMQEYYVYAVERLERACGDCPAASRVCYGLGKVHTALHEQPQAASRLSGPRSMFFHRVALRVDANNHLAANELGVLLARFGQLEEARQTLIQSLSVRPMPEAWHNLAVVHERLGEYAMAQLARNEFQIANAASLSPPGPRGGPAPPMIQWVDPGTFAQTTGAEPPFASPPSHVPRYTAQDGSRSGIW
jgi:tetratricopeptide (TPR) repeat protein